MTVRQNNQAPRCTVCIVDGDACVMHRWERRYGDDIRAMRDSIDAGEIDFRELEMVS